MAAGDTNTRIATRLVLSEGHAVPILYAAYADLGGYITPPGKSHDRSAGRPMTKEDALSLREIGSAIDGHPHPQVGFPFADAATGSLGQGLSVAAGLGAAAKMDKVDRNIYCIIGDGESREGQIWEAADFIADHALTNVVPIFNCNELAQSDWVSPQQSYQGLADKLKAFGFIVREVDGHDPLEIAKALNELHVIQNGNRPLAIVARTVKGWGASAEQGMGKHGTPVKKDKMGEVLAELDKTAKDMGVADYKANRLPPRALAEVPVDYVTQLALYRAVLAPLYRGHEVRAALVWTAGPNLMEVPASALDAALSRVARTA